MAISRKLFPLTILMLGCWLVLGGCGGPRPAADQPGPASEPVAQPKAKAEPGVVVTIEAYYPLNDEHQYIADYLQELEDRYQGKVGVQVWDTATSEGRKQWMASGLTCMGVFVNGKTTHEITREGEQTKVSFLKRMDAFWEREDLELVVEQLLAENEKDDG